MKIAVCLSGHFRKFEQTYPTLYFYLLRHYDCDIFIHTWDRLGYSCKLRTDLTLDYTNNKIHDINNLYKPKRIIVESSAFVEELKRQADIYAPHLKNCPKHIGHMSSMFYKIYACNELRKNYEIESGTSYDLIVRCRPDLLFNHNVVFPAPNTNTVLISKAWSSIDWYNDQFAVADPHSMDLYSSTYFDIPSYFGEGREYYPEKFLKWSLDKKKLKIEQWNVYFTILR